MRGYAFAVVLLCLFVSMVAIAQQSRPPQYVIISYDGSLSIPMWKATRELAQSSQAQFTYFVSGVYFLTDENKKLYKGPRRPSGGKSAIGFGKDQNDLYQRIDQVFLASEEGHKMSSHVNGHFDGGYLEWNGKVQGENWTFEEWSSEFDAFHWLLNFVFENNSLEEKKSFQMERWKEMLSQQLRGLRAPQLGVNSALWKTLARDYVSMNGETYNHRYTYDSSKSAPMGTWPSLSSDGIWDMPLGYIPIYGTNRRTIAMDFNFYAYHSKAKPDPEKSDAYRLQTLLSYYNYFSASYNGNRAPVNIGHHFSTWNGGAYWKALVEFTQNVCILPEVVCTTFDEYQTYLENLSPDQLQDYKKGRFDVSGRPELPDFIQNPPRVQFVERLLESTYNDKMGCTPQAHEESVELELLNY